MRYRFYENEAGSESSSAGSNTSSEASSTSGSNSSPSPISTDDVTTGGNDPTIPTWMLTETVKGEGAPPDWLKSDKYSTVEAQAKAYKDLETKFGSFTGAPDEYELTTSDELKEKGIEFKSDDPIVEEFGKWAKDAGLNQEGYNGLLQLKGMIDLADQQAMEDTRQAEFKALGHDGQARVDNINTWAQANLSEEQALDLQGIASSASAVGILEALIGKSRNAPISPDAIVTRPSVSEEEVRAMQFEKDEHGNRKLHTDPEFRARYQKLSLQVRGAEPARQIVGS